MTAAVGYRWEGSGDLPLFATCDRVASTAAWAATGRPGTGPAAARAVFAAAVAAHAAEAAYAAATIASATSTHCTNAEAAAWVLQTFVLGYPSLRLLLLLQRREGAKLLARPRLLLRRCRFERRSIEGRTGLDCSERRFCLGPLNAEALPRWVARVGLALALTLARA
mmetsp:Transcript_24358/g.60580  ORF Transcript_24358/g.60580 Transcript_24358/m.60580 type:complete len:167 (-) Transcript_24358:2811-3311(-)